MSEMNDKQLADAIRSLLPDDKRYLMDHNDTRLTGCWLIRVKHMMPLHVGSQEPWQEQAENILNYTR